MNKFYKIMFFNLLLLSTLITISSYSWFMMWLGVEINMMSMIPIMLKKNNIYSSEASLKYFLVQSLGSTVLMFSLMLMESMMFLDYSMMIVQTSLIMKLGMVPFHSWLPEVMEGLTWLNCLIMLTWQKISPMMMLMMLSKNSLLIILSIISSSLISGIQGLNQISLRKIMTYSSINHMSWMMMSLMSSTYVWMIYFLIYSISNLNLILVFNSMKISVINQINSLKMNKYWKIMILMNFLSLGGMPPMIGFFPKWLTIHMMITNMHMFMMLILVMSTLIHMYFYTRIMLTSLVMKIKEPKLKINWMNKQSLNLMVLNSMFLFSLPLMNMNF
nr:NADH dehydrogenase subunit 2 [Cassidinae sp. N35]